MKIIFDNHIKDYPIKLIELGISNQCGEGTFEITNQQDIKKMLQEELYTHDFSIVNDSLRQHFQRCYASSIGIYGITGTVERIKVNFVVTTVGKSSLPIPSNTNELHTISIQSR